MSSKLWIAFVDPQKGKTSPSSACVRQALQFLSEPQDAIGIVSCNHWKPLHFERFVAELETKFPQRDCVRLLAVDSPSAKKWLGYLCGRWNLDFHTSVRSLGCSDGKIVLEKSLLGGRVVSQLASMSDASWGICLTNNCFVPNAAGPERGEKMIWEVEENQPNEIVPEEDVPELEVAPIIVGAGMAFRTQEDLAVARSFARVQNAAFGATRPLADSGLVPHELQIGQTGKSVSPHIYWAVGISGAVHHWAGIRKSQCVIAVNTDPNAPIFQYADYGIVGDFRTVLPALESEYLKARKTDA